jgi:hypothetical protein
MLCSYFVDVPEGSAIDKMSAFEVSVFGACPLDRLIHFEERDGDLKRGIATGVNGDWEPIEFSDGECLRVCWDVADSCVLFGSASLNLKLAAWGGSARHPYLRIMYVKRN